MKYFWHNYRLMRIYSNGVFASLRKARQLCLGKKVQPHPGRRSTNGKET